MSGPSRHRSADHEHRVWSDGPPRHRRLVMLAVLRHGWIPAAPVNVPPGPGGVRRKARTTLSLPLAECGLNTGGGRGVSSPIARYETSIARHEMSIARHESSTARHETSTARHETSTARHETSTARHETSTARHETSCVYRCARLVSSVARLAGCARGFGQRSAAWFYGPEWPAPIAASGAGETRATDRPMNPSPCNQRLSPAALTPP